MLEEDLRTWASAVDQLRDTVKEFIKNNKLPATPSYDDIVKRKMLYESYSKVIELNNELVFYLDKVIAMHMLRNEYKKVVRVEFMQTSLANKFIVYIDEVSERVNLIDKELSNYKYGLDNQLRFYQSIQYILGSPRLSSME